MTDTISEISWRLMIVFVCILGAMTVQLILIGRAFDRLEQQTGLQTVITVAGETMPRMTCTYEPKDATP